MDTYICSKCKIEKPIDCFFKDKTKKSGHKSQCKDCVRNNNERAEYLKIYRNEHADYFREKHAEFRARNRERLRIKSKLRNPEYVKQYYSANKVRLLDYCKRYRKTEHGKEIRTFQRIKRRTAMSTGDKDITLEKLYNRDGGICALCGDRCDYEDYIFQGDVFIAGNKYPSIDHIKPLSRGGGHTWDNVQLAHKQCNSIKSNKGG